MTYEQYLIKATDVIFERATYQIGWDWKELAQIAGLSYSTVYRLGMRQTRFPQLRTFFKLAQAVNMNMPEIKTQLKKSQKT